MGLQELSLVYEKPEIDFLLRHSGDRRLSVK